MMLVKRFSQTAHWWLLRSLPSCNVAPVVSIVEEDGDDDGDGDGAVDSIVVAVVVIVADVAMEAAPAVVQLLAMQRLRNCLNVAVVESGSDCSGDGNVMCGAGCGDGSDAIVEGGVKTFGGGCKFDSSSYDDCPSP